MGQIVFWVTAMKYARAHALPVTKRFLEHQAVEVRHRHLDDLWE